MYFKKLEGENIIIYVKKSCIRETLKILASVNSSSNTKNKGRHGTDPWPTES